MAKKSSTDTYALQLTCTNCGVTRTYHIPLGITYHHQICENCACCTLSRVIERKPSSAADWWFDRNGEAIDWGKLKITSEFGDDILPRDRRTLDCRGVDVTPIHYDPPYNPVRQIRTYFGTNNKNAKP